MYACELQCRITPNADFLAVRKGFVQNIGALVDVALGLECTQEASCVAILAIQTVQVALIVLAVCDIAFNQL